jgi:hypothetical protein
MLDLVIINKLDFGFTRSPALLRIKPYINIMVQTKNMPFCAKIIRKSH